MGATVKRLDRQCLLIAGTGVAVLGSLGIAALGIAALDSLGIALGIAALGVASP
jgi:hypothetical protein